MNRLSSTQLMSFEPICLAKSLRRRLRNYAKEEVAATIN
jgi:hypothetical protein